MTESILQQYFDNKLDASALREHLGSIRHSSSLIAGKNFCCDLKDDYEVGFACIQKLCNDYIEGLLDRFDIESIAFFLMGSDHFEWDCDTEHGAVIAEIIDDWNSPEIDYPINRRNMKMILRGLDEGVYDPGTLSHNG